MAHEDQAVHHKLAAIGAAAVASVMPYTYRVAHVDGPSVASGGSPMRVTYVPNILDRTVPAP